MRLKPYKVGNEPGNATKAVTLVKNVLTCRNSLYNLRHHGRTHFCQFGLERYSTTITVYNMYVLHIYSARKTTINRWYHYVIYLTLQ